jgi:hypothetical protein
MAANDHEVFNKLVGTTADRTPINFITYALFAFERREWMAHFKAIHTNDPTQADIDTWTSNFTDSQFASLQSEAAAFFDAAARSYLEDEITEGKREILDAAILREVRVASGLGRQIGFAVMAAVLAPVIIGGFIALAILFEKLGPTVSGMKDRILGNAGTPAAADTPDPGRAGK